ncbi:hypothetical protein MHTCC0001_21790 [Flavobacteriaceae bacterium MHTCC 0001]
MNRNDGITCLSLFDGISIGQLALKQLGIKVNKYYASEIDPNPIKVTQHHFPNTIQLGDIRNIDPHVLPKCDLVLCGSSCQDLSVMNKQRLGLQGNKSSVFFDAVRILNVIRKKNPNCIFIFENVQMPTKDRQIFTELLGVEPININSGLLGPALRNRLYFTNLDVTIPEDKGIYLNDVIENGMLPPNTKGKCVLTRNIPYTVNGLHRHIKRSVGNVVYLDKQYCDLSKRFKKIQLEQIENNESVKRLFRPISLVEAERCMTIPDNYTAILKPTARLKCLGNAYHLETIKWLLKHSGWVSDVVTTVPVNDARNVLSKAS